MNHEFSCRTKNQKGHANVLSCVVAENVRLRPLRSTRELTTISLGRVGVVGAHTGELYGPVPKIALNEGGQGRGSTVL